MEHSIEPGMKFATTQYYPDDPRWFERAEETIRPPKGGIMDEFRMVRDIVRASREADAMVLNSSWGKLHPDLIAAAIIALLYPNRRPVSIMMGCMWQKNPGIRGKIEEVLVKIADNAIDGYAVQSSEELTMFPDTWGVSQEKMYFVPYFWTLNEEDKTADSPRDDEYIFAGGNSHRDYGPLIEAAGKMPDHRFVIATTRLDPDAGYPPNVTVGGVPHQDFMGLMRGSMFMALPLRKDGTRAYGQQTYLNAMWMGKLVIVTDTAAVGDHIIDGESGLVVDGSVEQWIEKITWAADPANAAEVERIAQEGQRRAREEFTFENHVTFLLEALDRTIERVQEDHPSAAR